MEQKAVDIAVEKARVREIEKTLRAFVTHTQFATSGCVMTDLDGTAVHEFEGRIVIPEIVAQGLNKLNRSGRPVVLNTLRFPLNVIRTFGREWYQITSAPLPLISLNGAQLGYLVETNAGAIGFEEVEAVTLTKPEIAAVVESVTRLVEGGISDILVFWYPRNWTMGEMIWTPNPGRVPSARAKYASATDVISGGPELLAEHLSREEICMIFLLADVPEDRRMAYQHARPNSFVTHGATDKLTGARAMAKHLGVALEHSIGAGDTPMDTFLSGVGLALHVGPRELDLRGLSATVRIDNSIKLGEALFGIAGLGGT